MLELPMTNAEIAAAAELPKYMRNVVRVAEIAARCAKELAVERGLRETAERMCARMQDERNATYNAHALGKLADELDEDNYASAAKALRKAIFMLDKAAQRDAAWARLVKATAEERDAAACAIADRERGARSSAEPERAALEAARQALLALGVDAALLSD